MATDIHAILGNLVSFYDFGGKDVVHVGAGGGQLIGYASFPRRITAIDSDASAIERLREKIREGGFEDRFSVLEGDFYSVNERADVVFLEFCLHEMADPARALAHAASMASETLIIDHLAESEWSWYACETDKIAASWRAVGERPIRRQTIFEATQRFRDFEELASKLGVLGEESRRRIGRFESCRDIEIPMPYGVALL